MKKMLSIVCIILIVITITLKVPYLNATINNMGVMYRAEKTEVSFDVQIGMNENYKSNDNDDDDKNGYPYDDNYRHDKYETIDLTIDGIVMAVEGEDRDAYNLNGRRRDDYNITVIEVGTGVVINEAITWRNNRDDAKEMIISSMNHQQHQQRDTRSLAWRAGSSAEQMKNGSRTRANESIIATITDEKQMKKIFKKRIKMHPKSEGFI